MARGRLLRRWPWFARFILRKRVRAVLAAAGCPRCGAYRCPDCTMVIVTRADHRAGCQVYWATARGAR